MKTKRVPHTHTVWRLRATAVFRAHIRALWLTRRAAWDRHVKTTYVCQCRGPAHHCTVAEPKANAQVVSDHDASVEQERPRKTQPTPLRWAQPLGGSRHRLVPFFSLTSGRPMLVSGSGIFEWYVHPPMLSAATPVGASAMHLLPSSCFKFNALINLPDKRHGRKRVVECARRWVLCTRVGASEAEREHLRRLP